MQLRQAILSTLSYHSKFNYPLTLDELHRFLLINRPVSSNEVKPELNKLTNQKQLVEFNSCYFLPKLLKFLKPLKLLNIRVKRRESSRSKLVIARRAARLIGFLPWIKLVCVTGSLAMENSDETDDIDLMIVAAKNRLWLTRPLVILLVSLFFNRRKPTQQFNNLTMKQFSNSLCLNLWLDSSALAMPPHRQDLRTAHELAQMKPLVNKDQTYEKMIWLNSWGRKFLANFWNDKQTNRQTDKQTNRQIFAILIHLSIYPFIYLADYLLSYLNYIFYKLQLSYMKPKITSEEVTLHSAFFHPVREYDDRRWSIEGRGGR